MSRSAPTPGPWTVERSYTDDGAFAIVAVIDGDLARLASRNPWSDRAAESMANALLMAAARDMYDVLKEFVGALGCESEDDYPCGRCLGCRGEAALASAEGRQ